MLITSIQQRELTCVGAVSRIVQCPDLSHLHMETRRKLQRSYDEGETARADKFLERLRCLRCARKPPRSAPLLTAAAEVSCKSLNTLHAQPSCRSGSQPRLSWNVMTCKKPKTC